MQRGELLKLIYEYADYYSHTIEDIDLKVLINELLSFDEQEVKSAFQKITAAPDSEFFPKIGKILKAIREIRNAEEEKKEKPAIKHPCQVRLGDSYCGAESFCNIGYCWKPKRIFFICYDCFQIKQEEQLNAKRKINS